MKNDSLVFCNKFINDLLPGNYALTKSMELNKISSSGTLWYIKKFVVLYNFIFLSNDIFDRTYISKIQKIYSDFIESLPHSTQNDAKKFFYTLDKRLDIRSDDFITFYSFTEGVLQSFSNKKDKEDYLNKSKKCYFALLMGTGGQTGIKKEYKNFISKKGFVFSETSVTDAINEAAITVCIEQVNNFHNFNDNSLKYFISEKARKEIINLSTKKTISKSDVIGVMRKYPHSSPNYNLIRNDFPAFIRNERQVLYYYGFFHSKSVGANDVEFSSLTPVGQLAVDGNFFELLSLWEHQKIKMISQPPSVEINNVPKRKNANMFSISYSPYLNILKYLERNNNLSIKEYMYIVSRRTENINELTWNKIEPHLILKIDDIEKTVKSFNRTRDNNTEDAQKELSKYMLGILVMPMDAGTNPIVCCERKHDFFSVSDSKFLENLILVYKSLNTYKLEKYIELFDKCKNDLKQRYIKLSGKNEIIDPDSNIKIHWDLYNINIDKFIYLTTALLISSKKLGFYFAELAHNKIKLKKVCTEMFNCYKRILRKFHLKTINPLIKIAAQIITAIGANDFNAFTKSNEDKKEILAEYKSTSSNDLLDKLKNISSHDDPNAPERKRNMSLPGLLKSFYVKKVGDDKLKCECCGKETFITTKKEMYLEFHHLIPFAGESRGPDHYLNLFALCPNCHRKLHYIELNKKDALYIDIDKNNFLKKTIVDRLLELKNDGILKSYHLEYLSAAKAITNEQYNKVA